MIACGLPWGAPESGRFPVVGSVRFPPKAAVRFRPKRHYQIKFVTMMMSRMTRMPKHDTFIHFSMKAKYRVVNSR